MLNRCWPAGARGGWSRQACGSATSSGSTVRCSKATF